MVYTCLGSEISSSNPDSMFTGVISWSGSPGTGGLAVIGEPGAGYRAGDRGPDQPEISVAMPQLVSIQGAEPLLGRAQHIRMLNEKILQHRIAEFGIAIHEGCQATTIDADNLRLRQRQDRGRTIRHAIQVQFTERIATCHFHQPGFEMLAGSDINADVDPDNTGKDQVQITAAFAFLQNYCVGSKFHFLPALATRKFRVFENEFERL